MYEGQTISHYRILETLGSGAMGVVCKAEDLVLSRMVALKTLAPTMLGDPAQKRILLEEARAASVLDHPNVCRIHQIEELPNGEIILIMGYYDGETLASRIERGPLELTEATVIASQILSGLQHAHENRVIHRDVKPSNVILDRQNTVKIVDFGLAKRPEVSSNLTQTGTIVGTITYMSPEQVLAKNVDYRSDLWAAGVVLFEMLSGVLPFRGDSAYAVFDSILRGPVPSVLELRPDLPPVIQQTIERSLARQPQQRFSSAAEFLAALLPFSRAQLEAMHPVALLPLVAEAKAKTGFVASVLVLPFAPLEAGEEADYFCDGLTDEIITDLSGVHSLRVICRTSAMQLKGTSEPRQKIARDLNVRYVLEGSARLSRSNSAPARIRVTAQLIDPESQSLVWADKFNGTLDDVFAIQETISRQIVSALKIQLSSAEDKRMLERPLPDIEAYRYYLMAKHEILNYSEEALARALKYLETGEKIVGRNVLLLAAKGQVYWQYVNAGISSDASYLAKARQCANEALELDPTSAHAFRLLGLISVQEGDSQKAVLLLKKAIVADPNDSDTLSWYSAVCGLSGKAHAAMPLARRILEIDPLTPVYRFVPGLLSLMGGEFADALPSFEEAIRLDPANTMLLWCRGQTLMLCHRLEDATAQFRNLEADHPGQFFTQLGSVMRSAMDGDREGVESGLTTELREIAGCDPHYSWSVAQCYALLGETEEALAWLEKAMQKGFINYPMISRWDPLLAAVRHSSGFDDLMDRMREHWENFEV